MKLGDFVYVRKLGEGQFGHVFLVKHAQTGELFALKGISKSQISEQKLERHTKVVSANPARKRSARKDKFSIPHDHVPHAQR